MAKQRNREEVINTQLAILISKLGVTADAETIHFHGQQRPDVLFQLRGLRAVIEGKFGDVAGAEQIVLKDARKRVQTGMAHIAAAVVYPLPLRSAATAKILDVLETSALRFCILTETSENESWHEGPPSALMESMRRAQESLTKDDIVEATAKALNLRLQAVAQLWTAFPGACDRLSGLLGIMIPKAEKKEQAAARRETAAKVSALVLANAFIFQDQLAAVDPRIDPLRKLEGRPELVDETTAHWKWVWQEINYVPIFQLGERILSELPSSEHTTLQVKALLGEARSICSKQAALRHDLMGRIYHWLLHHAKFLGTYYTSVPAATLLLKLALAAEWGRDFGDPAELARFRVADLACGTGTLLMASAQAITDSYIKTRAEGGLPLEQADLSILHRTLMENMLHGYDVLPSAIHLTASTLAMLAPEVAFVKMNLFVIPMGVDHGKARLGSLDFLGTNEIRTQMALDYSHVESLRMGASSSQRTNAKVPTINLCVMNPPFVRSVGGNLLFGSLPDDRGKMQKELKKRVKKIGANANAGLGSVFIAVADMHLARGGRLAFVTPIALASGESWAPSRSLIGERYHLETVVASHDSERLYFSENTDISEILFIAKRLGPGDLGGPTTYINLWRNARTIYEAIDLANRIAQIKQIVSINGTGITSIGSGDDKVGEMFTVPAVEGGENWTGALFAQTELMRTAWHLQFGKLRVPGDATDHMIPVCRLDKLGSLGPDVRRLKDGFLYSSVDWSPYPAFWGHKSGQVTKLDQKSNGSLLIRADSPKKVGYGAHLWERAGNILIVERLRSNTHRVIGLRFDKPILGNTWWSFQPFDLTELQQKTLLLWLNSSLSLLLVYARRVITQGAWFKIKQPAWKAMPVLDVQTLTAEQLQTLGKAYDSIVKEELKPLAQLASDDTRKKIDESLARALGFPDFGQVRELFAREPGLSAHGINQGENEGELDDDDEEDE